MRLTKLLILSLIFITAQLSAAPCTSGSPNLVSNCGFETGDFTAWTLSGSNSAPGYNGIDYGVDSFDAHSGAYGAYLGGFGAVLDLNQSIATTPGSNYTISFWIAQSPTPIAPYLDSFSASFGSAHLLSLVQVPNTAFTQYSFSAQALSSTSMLTFGVRDDTGFFSIDDVSVTVAAVPEPNFARLWGIAALLLSATFGRRVNFDNAALCP